MSDDTSKHEAAAPSAAPGAGASQTGTPPRVLRLGVRTRGTPDTTEVYDLDTGAVVHFDAWMHGVLDAGPGRPNRGRLVLTFDVPVEASAQVQTPVDIHGFSVGAKQGQPPAPPDNAARPPTERRKDGGQAIGGGTMRRKTT